MRQEHPPKELKSPIFDLMCGHDDDDAENLVAYALYKRDKRQWCRDFEEREDRQPNAKEKLEYALGVSTDHQITRYKKDAQNYLLDYAAFFVEEARPGIFEQAVTHRMEMAAKTIEASSTIHRLVFQGVLTSFATAIILVLMALGIKMFGIDLIDAVAF